MSLSAEPESARRPPQADAVAREGRDLTESDQSDAGRYSRMGFTELQRLLRKRRSDDAGSAGRVVVDTDELMSVLSRLQEATGLDVDTSALRRRLNDELRQGGGGRDRALGRMDEDTLDLVFLLFEHVLRGNDIPEALKSLIGRLQVPFLKVALQDKSVFDDKHHPARRLLNHLAEAAMGWERRSGQSFARQPLQTRTSGWWIRSSRGATGIRPCSPSWMSSYAPYLLGSRTQPSPGRPRFSRSWSCASASTVPSASSKRL